VLPSAPPPALAAGAAGSKRTAGMEGQLHCRSDATWNLGSSSSFCQVMQGLCTACCSTSLGQGKQNTMGTVSRALMTASLPAPSPAAAGQRVPSAACLCCLPASAGAAGAAATWPMPAGWACRSLLPGRAVRVSLVSTAAACCCRLPRLLAVNRCWGHSPACCRAAGRSRWLVWDVLLKDSQRTQVSISSSKRRCSKGVTRPCCPASSSSSSSSSSRYVRVAACLAALSSCCVGSPRSAAATCCTRSRTDHWCQVRAKVRRSQLYCCSTACSWRCHSRTVWRQPPAPLALACCCCCCCPWAAVSHLPAPHPHRIILSTGCRHAPRQLPHATCFSF